MSPVEYRTIL
ncbi:hypothetical protein A2U01_0087903, partial [Trifolium medium]|nr:hypothetical protein [Trifolium medium]